MRETSKLGLGGHSFIERLGNDPPASPDAQAAIVAAGLDNGIRLIDTTYYQERLALGRILHRLGRRDEARIMAWNFFRQPRREEELVRPTPYEPAHLAMMLAELRTDRIDVLVVHAHDDSARLAGELALARRWRDEGKVGQVALGMVHLAHLQRLPDGHPVTWVLAPYNAFNRAAAHTFARARELGLGTIALSPFLRGWKLDEIGEDKALVAPLLLRWVASQPLVDRVIVAMRRRDWIDANLQAIARGPLAPDEHARLEEWVRRVQ